jgi:hypothetical protein
VDGGSSLAPTSYLRFLEINGYDFGEGAAEVDEKSEGCHLKKHAKFRYNRELHSWKYEGE